MNDLQLLQSTRTRSNDYWTGGLFDDECDESGDSENMATVSSDAYHELLPVANMTVARVRARFRDRMGITDERSAYLDGIEVGGDTVIKAGQSLSFQILSGVKGHG